MFWRSVVGKLWFTILLLVCFVLFILTVLLLEFFENYHVLEAEKELLQDAAKVSDVVSEYEEEQLILSMTDLIKDPSSEIVITNGEEDLMTSNSNDSALPQLGYDWFMDDAELATVVSDREEVMKVADVGSSEMGLLVVGTPLKDEEGAVFVYQSLNTIEETSEQTTKIIFLGAGIAIILTTIFAFFLSTRITSPLIKMRKGALELTKGEFNTKIPIRTHDEIGELAMAFNRMGRQLKFHIDALNHEKEQLSGILRSMADGVLTMNRQGDILVSNPPADQYLNAWSFENEEQLTDDEASRKVLPSPMRKLFEEVINLEHEQMTEVTVQGRSWVIIMTPLYDQDHIRGAVAVLRDMTEERRLDKLRKDFIANVSHELRTPISMLQGYSEAIVDDIAESREDKNELAAIIHDESLRIGRLVNELLDLARMEAGHISLRVEEIEVEPFIEKILRKFKGLADEKQVKLDLNLTVNEQMIRVDADRIEQVLTNLIDNAIRHTSVEGFVSVDVKTDEELFIQVTDSGYGIHEEDLPFIFERFYKADKSRKRESSQKGTGLGLAIAKNIVEAHKGNIQVHSKLNEGTTFTVQIPNERDDSEN
ncbi:sensor histidine kinase ResE [Halobacillus andaensis]|uniref:histidine kinase n=1 Tax=Halobacillus andaensis TaxID=1176239 RepID=A0A917B0B9_HALAA|nr:ATP-binding protein [Halobacillus andaensis]MBP2003230.1 two-component system sensor histidine kinase ResE [Halobacillus andaensis]GGF09077.1 sensor histidine kinase ResE [Halobacillus andaensis]